MSGADDVYMHTPKETLCYILFRIVELCIMAIDEFVFLGGFGFWEKVGPKKKSTYPCGFVKEIVKDLHMLIGS